MSKKKEVAPVNIKVIVRSRPLSVKEKEVNTPVVIRCNPVKKEVHVSSQTRGVRIKKKYIYDGVYGQFASQEEVFEGSIQSIIDQVLMGYNCTVFAYGQTGTGKTFTMQGQMDQPELYGIVPRSVQSIFERLQQNAHEYSVKVSCLEIYNEELEDLLDDTIEKKDLRIFEERSSKGGVSIPDLLELAVENIDDIFTIIKKTNQKRSSAATLMNENSSRSHCIFTVKIHAKEIADDGQQTIRTGTLNLVDLAGSESLGKSGAKNERAKETGKINQSLLTLGRVINKLVDGDRHIPYRDSKLTRLLSESLGGCARTIIVATVSPASVCLDETLNTLDYACRAKNIKNKPQINESKTQKAYVQELSTEISDLQLQLEVARSKNGIYVSEEHFEKLQADLQSKSLLLQEFQEELKIRKEELSSVRDDFERKERELQEMEAIAERLSKEKGDLESALSCTQTKLSEEKFVTNILEETEKQLRSEALVTKDQLVKSIKDSQKLHQKIGTMDVILGENKISTESTVQQSISGLEQLNGSVSSFVDKARIEIQSALDEIKDVLDEKTKWSLAIAETRAAFNSSHEAVLEELIAADQSQSDEISSFSSTSGGLLKERLSHQQSQVSVLSNILKKHFDLVHTDLERLQSALQDRQTELSNVTRSFSSRFTEIGDTFNLLVNDLETQLGVWINEQSDAFEKRNEVVRKAFLGDHNALKSDISKAFETFQRSIDEALSSADSKATSLSASITESTAEHKSSSQTIFQLSKAKVSAMHSSQSDMLQKASTSFIEACAGVSTSIHANEESLLSTLEDSKSSQQENEQQMTELSLILRNDANRLEELIQRLDEQSIEWFQKVRLNHQSASEAFKVHEQSIGEIQALISVGTDCHMDNLKKVLLSMCNSHEEFRTLQNASSEQISRLLEKLVLEGLKKYQISGETPKKRKIQVISDFVRSGKREELLKKFRSSQTVDERRESAPSKSIEGPRSRGLSDRTNITPEHV